MNLRKQRILSIFMNPIWVKSVHARLRVRHMVSWGIITLVLATFLSMFTYWASTEQAQHDPATASKIMLLPILVLQAVIMMLLGTGSVASQIALERDTGLLDYHRMTPMSPVGRIVGYLFGLPVREYFLFLLTLPYAIFAAVRGEIPASTMLTFYGVFFSSVWLYHLTGMVAGMASTNPRRAALVSQGLVALLYILLPNLSRLGLTFFGFFTIVPTTVAMIESEIPGSNLNAIHSVPLFATALSPAKFTWMVQSFMSLLMASIVYRKWNDQGSHVFSKMSALAFFSGVLLLLLGTLYPSIVEQRFYGVIAEGIERVEGGLSGQALQVLLYMFLVAFMLLCGAAALVAVHFSTPNRHVTLAGLHRALKLGRSRVPFHSDAASSLPYALAMVVGTVIAFVFLIGLARDTGVYFEQWPRTWDIVAPLLFFGCTILFVQGMRECLGGRAFLLTMFLVWMVPLFTGMTIAIAGGSTIVSTYVAAPFPPVGIALALEQLLHDAVPIAGQEETHFGLLSGSAIVHRGPMVTFATVLYVAFAVIAQLARFLRRRQLHEASRMSRSSKSTMPSPLRSAGQGGGQGPQLDSSEMRSSKSTSPSPSTSPS